MTADEVLRYIQLARRKMYILTHSGIEWLPEYEEDLQQINQGLDLLRLLVDAEHAKRKELERCSQQQKQY